MHIYSLNLQKAYEDCYYPISNEETESLSTWCKVMQLICDGIRICNLNPGIPDSESMFICISLAK